MKEDNIENNNVLNKILPNYIIDIFNESIIYSYA